MSNVKKALEVWVQPVQDVEDALQQLLTGRYVATAEGDNLDAIGAIVGQPRGGISDDDLYRRYIRARVAANRSRGVTEDLIRVGRLVVFDDGASIVVDNQGIASVVVRVEDAALADTVAAVLLAMLQDSVVAGVRVLAEWSPAAPGARFRTATAGFLSGATLAGATTLTLRSHYREAATWPQVGSVVLDEGTTAEETVTYASKDDDNLYGVSATANNHDANTAVRLVGQAGLGFCSGFAMAGGLVGGETEVPVDATTGFDASGTIKIDAGLATEEVLAYSSLAAGPPRFVLAAGVTVANAHPVSGGIGSGVTQGGGALASAAG